MVGKKRRRKEWWEHASFGTEVESDGIEFEWNPESINQNSKSEIRPKPETLLNVTRGRNKAIDSSGRIFTMRYVCQHDFLKITSDERKFSLSVGNPNWFISFPVNMTTTTSALARVE